MEDPFDDPGVALNPYRDHDGLWAEEKSDLQEHIVDIKQALEKLSAKHLSVAMRATKQRILTVGIKNLASVISNFAARPPPTPTTDLALPILSPDTRSMVRKLHNLLEAGRGGMIKTTDTAFGTQVNDEVDALFERLTLTSRPMPPKKIWTPSEQEMGQKQDHEHAEEFADSIFDQVPEFPPTPEDEDNVVIPRLPVLEWEFKVPLKDIKLQAGNPGLEGDHNMEYVEDEVVGSDHEASEENETAETWMARMEREPEELGWQTNSQAAAEAEMLQVLRARNEEEARRIANANDEEEMRRISDAAAGFNVGAEVNDEQARALADFEASLQEEDTGDGLDDEEMADG